MGPSAPAHRGRSLYHSPQISRAVRLADWASRGSHWVLEVGKTKQLEPSRQHNASSAPYHPSPSRGIHLLYTYEHHIRSRIPPSTNTARYRSLFGTFDPLAATASHQLAVFITCAPSDRSHSGMPFLLLTSSTRVNHHRFVRSSTPQHTHYVVKSGIPRLCHHTTSRHAFPASTHLHRRKYPPIWQLSLAQHLHRSRPNTTLAVQARQCPPQSHVRVSHSLCLSLTWSVLRLDPFSTTKIQRQNCARLQIACVCLCVLLVRFTFRSH